MASSICDGAPSTFNFKCEEFDEYLLIEDTPRQDTGSSPEQITEPRSKEARANEEATVDGSLDSGYEGKHSRTGSPEVKPNQAAVEMEVLK